MEVQSAQVELHGRGVCLVEGGERRLSQPPRLHHPSTQEPLGSNADVAAWPSLVELVERLGEVGVRCEPRHCCALPSAA